jgi:hypothetical protein
MVLNSALLFWKLLVFEFLLACYRPLAVAKQLNKGNEPNLIIITNLNIT